MSLKAVIFDKDGVLVDTEGIIAKSIDSIIQKHGAQKHYTLDDRLKYGGMSAGEAFVLIKKDFLVPGKLDDLIGDYRRVHLKNLKSSEIKVFEGVKDFLLNLKKEKIKVAVATGSTEITTQNTLGRTDISSLFDSVVTSSDVKNGKPAPDIFLLAAERLGVSSSECIVVGDSHNDRVSAKRAGMKFVFKTEKELNIKDGMEPDIVVKSLTELKISDLKMLFENK